MRAEAIRQAYLCTIGTSKQVVLGTILLVLVINELAQSNP